MNGRIVRITAPHFCAGIILYEKEVHYKKYNRSRIYLNTTAPILHYMEDWTFGKIARYCKIKNWKCELLKK